MTPPAKGLRTGLALTLILCVAGLAHAQQPESGQLYLGLSGGAPRTTLVGDFIEDTEEFWGMHYGGYVEYGLARNLLVDLELNFVRTTTRADVTSGESVTFGITRIEVPVLLEGVLPVGPTVLLGAYAGGSAAFVLECTSGTGLFGPSTDCNDTDLPLEKKSTLFNAVAGGGLGFSLGDKGGAILFDVRYTHGLTAVMDGPGNDIRSRSLSLIGRASIPILR